MRTMTRHGHQVTVLVLLLTLVALPVEAGEAPWREEVEPSDRALLDRLLSADEATRQGAAEAWNAAWIAAQPSRGRYRALRLRGGALTDKVDPRDTWGLRKKRMMTALASALQLATPDQRVAATRSIRDLAPVYASVIDILAATLTEGPTALRREVLRALGLIARSRGGRYVDTKLGEVLACAAPEEETSVRAAALDLLGSRLGTDRADEDLRRRALASARQGAEAQDVAVRAAALGAASALAAADDEAVVALLRRGLGDDAPPVRRNAACGLADRPAAAQADLTRLRALLTDDDFGVRYAAARAVWAASRDVSGLMPILIESLSRFEGEELAGVARLLRVIGPPAEAATPGLVRALGRIERVRPARMHRPTHLALVSIGPGPDLALPAIEEELERRGAADRPVVLDAVVAVHAEPERLAAFTLEMLSRYRCPDPQAVETSVFLGLRLESPALLARLEAQLESDDPREWRRAWYDLGRLGTPGAVRLLIEKMGDPEKRMSAIIALMEARERAKPAVPALLRALPEDPGLAADALVRIGGFEDPEVVKALLAVLEKTPAEDHGTAVSLCHGICLYGGPLEPCCERLIAAFGDRNPMMHRDAADALGCWGPEAKKALPVLRKTMAEGEADYEGITAATAVWRITGEAGPTYEMATKILRDGPYPSWLAVHALRLLGPEAAEAVPLLVEMALSWRTAPNPQEDVMKESILALGAIGPAAAESLPVLRELERNHLVRAEARQSIERIEKR